MPVGTNNNNGKETNKVNGEDESSNSDGDSSSCERDELFTVGVNLKCSHCMIDDEDESERRKGDCLEDIQYLEQQFSELKEL